MTKYFNIQQIYFAAHEEMRLEILWEVCAKFKTWQQPLLSLECIT